MNPNKKDKQINIRLAHEISDALHAKAMSEGRSIGEVIRGLLLKWLKQKG